MNDVPKAGDPAYENKWGVSVGGYAPGAESEIAPPNSGSYIPPGGAIGFQNHYTPYGKEVTEHTRIGLYYYKDNEKPDLMIRSTVIVNPAIEIPAGDAHHQEMAYVTFPRDALLYAAFPHAHYRAISADLWIQRPDGKLEELLSLPRYDFNWQRHYTFATPIKITAGSKLIAHFVYDNSKNNPSNPDPTIKVTWGEQSFQEMLYMPLTYRWLDETTSHPVTYDQDMNKTRMIGMFDTNLDGKLEKSELKGQMGQMLLKYFDALDKNHDGYLDESELAAAQSMMGFGRRPKVATK